MSLTKNAGSLKQVAAIGTTEFEILKASHKFLRDDNEKDLSWEDQMAKKYYSALYREFAVCDLKHYRSGNFALRWRTEEEVLAGVGEETCGNTRCTHHETSKSIETPPLKTVELPFMYEEHGEHKSALVKVVLCDKCLKKLMWKREKEKEQLALEKTKVEAGSIPPEDGDKPARDVTGKEKERQTKGEFKRRDDRDREDRKRRRSSRSLSPTSRRKKHSILQRSPDR